jgi:hypothetical protein
MTVRQHVQHRIVGYDPASERLAFSFDLPIKALAFLGKFVRFEDDDPDGYDAYKVEYAIVRDVAGMLKIDRPPPQLDYFLEPVGARLAKPL